MKYAGGKLYGLRTLPAIRIGKMPRTTRYQRSFCYYTATVLVFIALKNSHTVVIPSTRSIHCHKKCFAISWRSREKNGQK